MKKLSPRTVGSLALATCAPLGLLAGALLLSSVPASAGASATLTLSVAGTSETGANASSYASIAYGDGEFVALGKADLYGGSSSTATQYSSNGVTWNNGGALPASAQWSSVAYGNGDFVAVAYSGTDAAYSTDGQNWTAETLPASANWSSVAYGNGVFVAVASQNISGTDVAAYSTDGQSWTTVTLPSTNNWNSITYGDGVFVAVGANTDDVAYSTNGTSWTTETLPASANWSSVTYGGGEFVAVGYESNDVAYSPDGINWTLGVLPGSYLRWSSVAYGNGEFVAENYTGNGEAYSLNGESWYYAPMPNTDGWGAIAYGNGVFEAVAYASSDVAVLPIEPQSTAPGNTYVAELDVTGSTPTGNVTISDSTSESCTPTVWNSGETDNVGGEYFYASCTLANQVPVGTTVSATYSGTDYSAPASNVLSIDGPPTIATAVVTGSPIVGDVLTATTTGVTGYPTPSATYQWYDGASAITNATSSTYTVAQSDLGSSIDVVVTESNGVGAPAFATSSGTSPVTLPTVATTTTTTTTTTTLPTTTTTTLPTTTTTPSAKPTPVNLGFSKDSASLTTNLRTALSILARQLPKGSHVTITGYAKANASLAHRRAEVAAAYLKAHLDVNVTLRWSTSSANKVTVVATKS